MRAARWYGAGDIRVEELPDPTPGPGQVKIQVKWCGICGTDLSEYQHGPMLVPAKRPHPGTGKQAPVTLGHEFSGDIVELGEGVTNLGIGERVTVWPLLPCFKCYWCLRGRYNECLTLGTIGLAADGAFANYVIAPSYGVHRLPEEVSYEAGTFAEPLAVVVRACKRGGISLGDTVAITGAGPIGLLALQAARGAGAGRIYVVEPQARRRELALKLGATAAFDPTQVDAGKEIARLTDNIRANVVMECSGVPAAIQSTLALSGRCAKIVMVGISSTPVEFPFDRLLFHEKEITTVQGYVDEYPAALSLLASGEVVVEPLISARIRLEDIVAGGFEALAHHPEDHIKILVSPL
ncbi:MAG TPA: 2,3-butanediol dehydrogenase [Dehalococcoidia bacterium]|nr:2,3-butanediol dehydrogenase [Dehalococcoidia bacterium]